MEERSFTSEDDFFNYPNPRASGLSYYSPTYFSVNQTERDYGEEDTSEMNEQVLVSLGAKRMKFMNTPYYTERSEAFERSEERSETFERSEDRSEERSEYAERSEEQSDSTLSETSDQLSSLEEQSLSEGSLSEEDAYLTMSDLEHYEDTGRDITIVVMFIYSFCSTLLNIYLSSIDSC